MHMKRLSSLARIFWDILFPPNANLRSLYTLCEKGRLSKLPKSHSVENLKWVTSLWNYKDGQARELIWQIKYRSDTYLAEKVAEVLYEKIIDEISEDIEYSEGNIFVLIPTPISKKRRRERGFNQTELICKYIEKIDRSKFFTYEPNVLARIDAPKQTDLKKTERLTSIKNQFSLIDEKKVSGKNFIIVDDVLTTGATLKEIRRLLMSHGAKSVRGFCLAH